MAARSPVRRRLVCTVAAIERHNPDDPRIAPLRAELATENLAEHIQRVISAAPPLSPEQAARLRALLPAPAGRNGP